VTNKHSPRELFGGRVATSVIFFALGAANGSWIGRIPDIQHALGLNSSVLGTVLLAGAVSGLLAMQIVPALLKRFGHRGVLGGVAPFYPLTILGLPFANNALTLGLALVLFSATGSILGVVVSTHAVEVEDAYERAIMSSFHAMYSVGGLIGAATAGLFASLHLAPRVSIALAAIVLTAAISCITPRLLQFAKHDEAIIEASIDHPGSHHRYAWWRSVIVLGAFCFVAYLSEGAIADWSGIFMRQERHAEAGIAVAAFMAFSGCMTVGRLLGDRLTMRFGKVTMIRVGATLGSIGLLVGIFSPTIITAVVGFALVGCGLAVLVPTLFSIAGGLRGGESHAAIARVSTIAFLGLLFGPALIGYTARHIGLQYALLIPALLLAIVASTAHVIHWIVRRSVPA
jgi:MFS family permease